MPATQKRTRSGKSKMKTRPKTRSVTQTRDNGDDGDNEATSESEAENERKSDSEVGSEGGSTNAKRQVAMLSPAPTNPPDGDAPADTALPTSTSAGMARADTTGTSSAARAADTARPAGSAITAPAAIGEGGNEVFSAAPVAQNTPTMAVMLNALQQLTTLVADLQPAVANATTGDAHNRQQAENGTVDMQATRSSRQLRATSSARERSSRRPPRRRHHAAAASSPAPSSSSESISSEASSDEPSTRARRSQQRNARRHNTGGSPSSGSSSSDEGSSSSNESGGQEALRRARRRRRRHQRPTQKKSVKDLELPTFTPSPKMAVSTWIDKVDLALRGAEESGRGTWTDKSLYSILGNKLMEGAATWWVDLDRRLPEREKSWSSLKKALLRRFGEKKDKATAEWRVDKRPMMAGETYADFAAGLRSVVGRNRVKERVLLAQFYRCLDKTTRKLVKQHPKPATLEEAVDKATEIDDPMDNVTQGMTNIGQPWAIGPSQVATVMDGTMGQTAVIPGISASALPALAVTNTEETAAQQSEVQAVALFTNPQGIYNRYSGTWDPVPGHVWNGKYWYEPRKPERKRNLAPVSTSDKASGKASAAKHKRVREVRASSDEELEMKPPPKKMKAAVKQTKAAGHEKNSGRVVQERGEKKTYQSAASSGNCHKCGQTGHWAAACSVRPKCYACGQLGHLARDCTDAGPKARNDEYLKTRQPKNRSEEN